MGDLVLLKMTVFKGKHKIQDHWEKTIYHVEGQPHEGLPVTRTFPVAGIVKMKIVHQNLLLPFGGNIEGGSENEGSWQDVNGPQDCILAVSDEVLETEVVSRDPKPKGDGDAICIQCLQTTEKLNYWVKTIWGWAISLYWHQ